MSNESGCGIGFELTAGGHLMMHVGFHADMICRHLECESVLIIRYRDTDGIVDICEIVPVWVLRVDVPF